MGQNCAEVACHGSAIGLNACVCPTGSPNSKEYTSASARAGSIGTGKSCSRGGNKLCYEATQCWSSFRRKATCHTFSHTFHTCPPQADAYSLARALGPFVYQVHPYAAHALNHYFSLDTPVTTNFYSAVSTSYDKGWGGEGGREGDFVAVGANGDHFLGELGEGCASLSQPPCALR